MTTIIIVKVQKTMNRIIIVNILVKSSNSNKRIKKRRSFNQCNNKRKNKKKIKTLNKYRITFICWKHLIKTL